MERMIQTVLQEINTLLETISGTVDAERSSFFLLDRDNQCLRSLAAQGVGLLTVSLDRGIAGHVARAGQPLLINDAQQSPLLDKSFDASSGYVTRQVLCVPIFDDTRQVIGVIQAINKRQGSFDERDLHVLTSFAATVALIIKNARLFELAQRGREDISTLLEVSAAISSELELDNLIRLIMEKASMITHAERSSLFILDEEHGELWTKYAAGLEDMVIRVPLSEGIVGKVAQSKEAYMVADAYQDPYFDRSYDQRTGYRTRSILSVPVLNPGRKLLGVIQVINKIGGVFGIQDQQILNGFAAQTSIAIENAKLFDEIKSMRNYLNDLLQHLSNGIVTVDRGGYIKTVNRSFCNMLGIDADELVGRHYSALDDKYRTIFHPNEEVIRTGRQYAQYGVVAPVSGSKRLIFNLNALPLRDNNGGNIGALSVIDDITLEKRIRENLSRYLPLHLIEEIMSKDDLSLLNGRSQTCSILFSDIRSFTTLTEKLGAIEIVALLNTYFHAMVDPIIQYQGVLDKFIGDAIMAVFGVPYGSEQDPVHAAHAALDMFAKLDQLNEQRRRAHAPAIQIGIGIGTGKVVSGNIGSEKRFEYTVIGDSVNLAARLESATKKYGVNILICEQTYESIRHAFICREIDIIRVKGKLNPTRIYTILGRRDDHLSTREHNFLNSYTLGLQHYRHARFDRAKLLFQLAQDFNEGDVPTQLFIERCDTLLGKAQPAYWDGVWELTEK